MRLAAVLASLVALAGASQAAPPPTEEKFPFDASAIKPHLRVLEDGKGHYVAWLPREAKVASDTRLFHGDDQELFALRTIGFSAQPGQFSFTVWEPRAPHPGGELDFSKGQYTFRCGKTLRKLSELAADKRKALLDKVRFYEPRWQRSAYALARDDRGTYYYVDRSRREERRRDFNLYVGKAGQLRQLKMKNVVSDSEGDIFATPGGTLRLVLNKGQALWIRGARRTKLLPLPIEDNVQLIYADLGVYAGRRLGTPCDDL